LVEGGWRRRTRRRREREEVGRMRKRSVVMGWIREQESRTVSARPDPRPSKQAAGGECWAGLRGSGLVRCFKLLA